MINECANCQSIWGPGSEEWAEQQCSACGWRAGEPVDEDDLLDENEDDYGDWPDDDDL